MKRSKCRPVILTLFFSSLSSACSGAPPTQEQIAAAAQSRIPAGSVPISEVAGTTQSLQDFCKSKPAPKVPNGQLSLDAVCAPVFVAKHKASTVKTLQQDGSVVLLLEAPTKVDEACAASSFRAPACHGFRPGDIMPGLPLRF
jgi:hypothetical protein